MADDLAAARRNSQQLNKLCDIVKAGSNISYTKAVMESFALSGVHVRAPVMDLDAEQREKLLSALEAY